MDVMKSSPHRVAATLTELRKEKRLIAFLLNPKSYAHKPKTVRLIQTHASWVFVAPPFAFKVKKSVNFGFLDFSTLEKRRKCCEREVELNRRLSPWAYLGVVPIGRLGNRLMWGSPPGSTVVEYAVQMQELDPEGFLDHRLARGSVRRSDLDRVASTLINFYRNQHPTLTVESWGRRSRLRLSTEENFRQTRPFIGTNITAAAWKAIRDYTNRFYREHAALFRARVEEKWIRDCHGDLRLEHVHFSRRGLQIFDCIEFNDRLRYVDVANDIAFLAMDFDFQGRSDLSTYLVTTLASGLGDSGMLRLMEFYKCYRAYVRGKVECLRSLAPKAGRVERQESAVKARRYFQLSLQYALAGSRPLVVVVMGRVGSGKSSVARAMAEETNWKLVSSDRVRKELAGLPVFERTKNSERKRLYSESMTARTYGRLFDFAKSEVKAGRSVILDATFGSRNHRAELLRRCHDWGVACRWVEVQAPDRQIRQRLRERERQRTVISDARLEDFSKLASSYEAPKELRDQGYMGVRALGPVPETLKRVLSQLAVL
jgi:aminoglycoside phosphotransferase family enzyme/predicted kinase